ncbi:MAG: SRPBCC family protein [Actinobacteria bacterium]|nr:SRPBCC family protein [Actinomycetota bacterium]
MTRAEFDVVIEAPPESVWEVISDPRNLPHWDKHIVRVDGVPASGLREGMRYTTEMRFFAFRTRVDGEVLEWDPPRGSTIRLSGLLDATVTSTIEPLSGGRSLLEHVVDYRFRGGPFGDIAARSLARVGGAHLALRRGTLAQKREIEERYGRGPGSVPL